MGEREWYFYSVRDRKYPTGLRTNRATVAGYWKATGKDREVYASASSFTPNMRSRRHHHQLLIGMKKTLVFYRGRAPRGIKTRWVMHEYRLDGPFSFRLSSKEEWVICRIFHKLGEKKGLATHQQQQQPLANSSSNNNNHLCSYHHHLRYGEEEGEAASCGGGHFSSSGDLNHTSSSLPSLLDHTTSPLLLHHLLDPRLQAAESDHDDDPVDSNAPFLLPLQPNPVELNDNPILIHHLRQQQQHLQPQQILLPDHDHLKSPLHHPLHLTSSYNEPTVLLLGDTSQITPSSSFSPTYLLFEASFPPPPSLDHNHILASYQPTSTPTNIIMTKLEQNRDMIPTLTTDQGKGDGEQVIKRQLPSPSMLLVKSPPSHQHPFTPTTGTSSSDGNSNSNSRWKQQASSYCSQTMQDRAHLLETSLPPSAFT